MSTSKQTTISVNFSGNITKIKCKPINTIKTIKIKVQEELGIPAPRLRLTFKHKLLNDNKKLCELDTNNNDPKFELGCHLQLGGAPIYESPSEVDARENKLKKNFLSKIQIKKNEFETLISNSIQSTYSIELSINIIDVIYEYANVIGSSRNVKEQWNDLHKYAKQGNIVKCEELLKNGYYIDQWTSVSSNTPLIWAIYSNSIDIVEFFIINGARRNIKRCYKELNSDLCVKQIHDLDANVKNEIIQMLEPILDQDPCV